MQGDDDDVEERRGLTPHEERELKRVYCFLLDFTKRQDLARRVGELDKLKGKRILERKRSVVPSAPNTNNSTSTTVLESDGEFEAKCAEIDALKADLEAHQKNFLGKITQADLLSALRGLGYKCSRRYVYEMIWEEDPKQYQSDSEHVIYQHHTIANGLKLKVHLKLLTLPILLVISTRPCFKCHGWNCL